jgi:hypothetical protein
MKEMRLSARLSNCSSNGVSQVMSIGSNEAAPRRGMVLPFNPLAMSFDNVNYYVDMPAVSSHSTILSSFSCPVPHHPQFACTFEHGTLMENSIVCPGNETARSAG